MRYLVCFLILVGLAGSSDRALADNTGGALAPSYCAEDDRCWQWSTMGNLKRGVFLRGEGWTVIEPCDFAFLDFYGAINWKKTPRLKGDGIARKHGCNPRKFA